MSANAVSLTAALLLAACGTTSDSARSASTLAASPHPLADGVRFRAEITHAFMPLASQRECIYESEDERVVMERQTATKMVAGVECTVLAEKEYEDGELAEISYNYFAQDESGNVYYFGEDVDDYENGQVTGHGGAWLVGHNASEPCLFMPAVLEVGLQFKRENSPPDAEEFDEIVALEAVMTLGGKEYKDVLVIREADQAGKWKERKYYSRGVGLISENGELNLVEVR